MATSDLNFTKKSSSQVPNFGHLLVSCQGSNSSQKCFITDIFLQCFIIARILENLGEFYRIFEHKRSLVEVAMERSSLKIYGI